MAGRQRNPVYAGSEIHGHQRLRSPIQFRNSEIPKAAGTHRAGDQPPEATNRPTRETALSFINAWTDPRQTRPPESKAYAMLNEMEQPVSANVIDAFRNYQISPVPWADRAQVVPELAA